MDILTIVRDGMVGPTTLPDPSGFRSPETLRTENHFILPPSGSDDGVTGVLDLWRVSTRREVEVNVA